VEGPAISIQQFFVAECGHVLAHGPGGYVGGHANGWGATPDTGRNWPRAGRRARGAARVEAPAAGVETLACRTSPEDRAERHGSRGAAGPRSTRPPRELAGPSEKREGGRPVSGPGSPAFRRRPQVDPLPTDDGPPSAPRGPRVRSPEPRGCARHRALAARQPSKT
jgi:hypothetical protein